MSTAHNFYQCHCTGIVFFHHHFSPLFIPPNWVYTVLYWCMCLAAGMFPASFKRHLWLVGFSCTSTLLSILLLSRATLQPRLTSVSLKISVDIVTDVARSFVSLNVCACMRACLHAWAPLGMKTVGLSVFVVHWESLRGGGNNINSCLALSFLFRIF